MSIYTQERILGEYENYIANSIYKMRSGNSEYFVTKFNSNGVTRDISDLDSRSAMEHLNFLFPNEFISLFDGLDINAINFSNNSNPEDVVELIINDKCDVPLLHVYPYSKDGRAYEYAFENSFMRFSHSSFNSTGKINTHLTFTEMTPEGLYVLNEKVVKFISIEDLRIIYNKTYSYQISFDDFLRKVTYAHHSHTENHMFKKIDVPSDDILFDNKIESVNLVLKQGFVNYLKSKSYGLPKDIEYDNAPMFVDGYNKLRDEISGMRR